MGDVKLRYLGKVGRRFVFHIDLGCIQDVIRPATAKRQPVVRLIDGNDYRLDGVGICGGIVSRTALGPEPATQTFRPHKGQLGQWRSAMFALAQ